MLFRKIDGRSQLMSQDLAYYKRLRPVDVAYPTDRTYGYLIRVIKRTVQDVRTHNIEKSFSKRREEGRSQSQPDTLRGRGKTRYALRRPPETRKDTASLVRRSARPPRTVIPPAVRVWY